MNFSEYIVFDLTYQNNLGIILEKFFKYMAFLQHIQKHN